MMPGAEPTWKDTTDAYQRGYQAGRAVAKEELLEEIRRDPANTLFGMSLSEVQKLMLAGRAARELMQQCQLCGGNTLDGHKRRCPNHPDFRWGEPVPEEATP